MAKMWNLGILSPKVFFYVIGNGDGLIVEIQLLKVTRRLSSNDFILS